MTAGPLAGPRAAEVERPPRCMVTNTYHKVDNLTDNSVYAYQEDQRELLYAALFGKALCQSNSYNRHRKMMSILSMDSESEKSGEEHS